VADTDFSYTSQTRAFYMSRSGSFAVIVWAGSGITEEAFREHCDAFAEAAKRLGPARVVLNHSIRFTPTPVQRAMVVAQAAGMGVGSLERVAIIAGSALVRGAATAIQWLLRPRWEIKLYAPSEISQALQWLLEIHPFDLSLATAEIDRGLELVGMPKVFARGVRGRPHRRVADRNAAGIAGFPVTE
jgi:hypothetical protein